MPSEPSEQAIRLPGSSNAVLRLTHSDFFLLARLQRVDHLQLHIGLVRMHFHASFACQYTWDASNDIGGSKSARGVGTVVEPQAERIDEERGCQERDCRSGLHYCECLCSRYKMGGKLIYSSFAIPYRSCWRSRASVRDRHRTIPH